MFVKAKWLSLVSLISVWVAMPAHAEETLWQRWRPTGVFVQAGAAEHNTQAYVLGILRDWRWQKQYDWGVLTGYSEASIGRWNTDASRGGSAWVTQLGITPVLRWSPDGKTNCWFVEVGVGGNVILPIYQTDEKSFSTDFNFGDHIAIGKRFGDHAQHEVALRLEHFSNGGIDHPNPGENFVQLRYVVRI